MTPGVRLGSLDVGGNNTGKPDQLLQLRPGRRRRDHDGRLRHQPRRRRASAPSTWTTRRSKRCRSRRSAPAPTCRTRAAVFQGIVKSGGNQFHGRYLFAGQSERMTGNNLDAALHRAGHPERRQAEEATTTCPPISAAGSSATSCGSTPTTRVRASRRSCWATREAPGPDGVFGTADDVQGYPPIYNANSTVKVSYQPSLRTKSRRAVFGPVQARRARGGDVVPPVREHAQLRVRPANLQG